MKKTLSLALLLATTLVSGAVAQTEMPKCEMKSKATLSVTAQGTASSANEAYAELQKIFKQVDDLGAAAKLKSFETEKLDYNISSNQSGRYGANMLFQYRASATHTLEPADKATALLAELSDKGLQGNVNVRQYREQTPACRLR